MNLTDHDADPWRERPVAVLVSGGLDSAILMADLARDCPRVWPIYVRFGLVWEEVEQRRLEAFLEALHSPVVAPLTRLDMPIRTVYGAHWSTTGMAVPGYDAPDESVFLPGRNLLLIVEAAIWCHLRGVRSLALAPLASNPFPDASDLFFDAATRAVNLAVEGDLAIRRPYAHLAKRDVMLLGVDFPLEHTFSCIQPVGDNHCGACNKCAERQAAFRSAELQDPTRYHVDPTPESLSQGTFHARPSSDSKAEAEYREAP
jgi:7-cyano-7-deazaguanine synthase